MSGIRVEGNTSGNVAEVDSNNNVYVNPPLTSSTAGFTSGVSENDHGSVTGARNMKEFYSSDDFRLNVGLTTPLFDYQFTGTAQDTGQWKCTFTTMTATESSGFLLLNSNSTATTATGVVLQTWRYFKVMASAEIYVSFAVNLTAVPLASQVAEFGLFVGTATTAPADGVYFRLTSAGLSGVVNFNGTETTIVLPQTLSAGMSYRCGVNITHGQTEFWVNDVLYGVLVTPVGNIQPFASSALPASIQQRNSGAVAGSPQMQIKCGSVRVEQDDLQLGAPLSHLYAAMGQAYQGQEGGTPGTLAVYVNNTTPGAAALTNTTALVTGLGGIAQVNPTLVAGTDGILFSYQNPVGGVSQIPKTLVITGVQIHGVVTTILSGGPVINAAVLNFGHTAVSLVTTEGASFSTGTTKIPRKIPIGFETYAATAAVGTLGTTTPLILDLIQSPVVVNPGEFVCVSLRNQGTVTASGAIQYICTFKHYWI